MEQKEYIVNVGPGGKFRNSGAYHTSPEDIDKMFETFEIQRVRKIALYFHGGLVNETGGINTAERVKPYILEAGVHPVFFVWETGLLETIGTNIHKIGETALFNKLLKSIIKRVSSRIPLDFSEGRGFAAKELSDEKIDAELSNPNPFLEYEDFSRTDAGRSGATLEALDAQGVLLETELQREFTIEIEKDNEFINLIRNTKLSVEVGGGNPGARSFIGVAKFALHAAKIAYRIIRRFIEKRDHDFYPTIIEEILREFYVAEVGAWVWQAMKDKSEIMWQSNSGRSGNEQYVGRYFLDRLQSYVTSNPECTVDLVGHSAGSIAVCNLLRVTSSITAPLNFKHIVFLAPACRVELFKTEILKNPNRYQDIRIFTMSDEYECKDILVPYFYTHSLLYLISGILEDESSDAHILGLERHIRFRSPYNISDLQDVHTYLYETGKDRRCYSVTANGTSDGLATHSQTHGGFDNDITTLTSLKKILQT